MSNTRRIAAAGFALAISGTFIAAPAQADVAAGTSSAHVTANAAPSHRIATAAAPARTNSVQSSYKSFSSSAKTPGQTRVAGGRSVTANVTSSAATTLYVQNDPSGCPSGVVGSGTADDPYCLIQTAVNNAVSGDTIVVWQSDDEKLGYNEQVNFWNKSGITLEGIGDGVADQAPSSGLGLDIVNSSHITVRNMVFNAASYDAANIAGDQNITLDGDYFVSEGQSFTAVEVSGSSNVTVSRSTIASTGADGQGVLLTENTSGIVLASDIISGDLAGVVADDNTGVDIVGNTIQASCSGQIDVGGNATGFSIENNVFDPSTKASSACTDGTTPQSGDINVSASAATGVTSDYNDFIFGSGNTAAYTWAGTTYATLADFQAAVSQGAHDAVDPTPDVKMLLTPGGVGTTATMNAQPVSTSLSIGTANTAAPGALKTDFFGQTSYTDRGAIQYTAPSLVAQLTVYQYAARTVAAYADQSVDRNAYATYAYNWGDGTTTAATTKAVLTHVYAHPGTYTVSVTVTNALGATSQVKVTTPTLGSDYVPITPKRILDTRYGTGTGKVAKIASGKSVAMTVGGVSVPKGVTAIAVNITATDTTAGGHVNAYADGAPSTSSNLDFVQGKNVANMAIVPVAQNGVVDFLNASTGSMDLIVDISGYFVAAQADGYKQIVPVRILDTNSTLGGHQGALTPSKPIKLKVAGVGGVPTDAKAVEVNLTAASPSKSSLVTAFPDGGSEPAVSNVNFSAGQTVANAAIVPIGSDGYIDIRTPVGSNRMLVDVDGYFSANLGEAPSAYVPVTPFRYLDTRNGFGPIPGLDSYGDVYWDSLYFGLDWRGNPYTPTVTGVVTNVTVTQAQASGYVTVLPDNMLSNGNLDIPVASSLNFAAGSTVANLVFATTGSDGMTDFLNMSHGNIQLIVDYFGFFQAA